MIDSEIEHKSRQMYFNDHVNFLKKLADKYQYQPLTEDLSAMVRKIYWDAIPAFLNCYGDSIDLVTSCGTKVTTGYKRIVIGDYGAYVEFEDEGGFVVKAGQEYRINDPNFSKRVKYVWLTTRDTSDVKIYLQKKKVSYADYKPRKYYVSVHEVYERKDV